MDIDKLCDDLAAQARAAVPEKKRKSPAGRKNKGITEKSYNNHLKEYAAIKKEARRVQQPDNFIIEQVQGDVIGPDDLQGFKELYQLTIDSIWEQFKEDNADLVQKHPYNYYKKLIIQIKKNVPRVGPEDIDKLFIIWDLLAQLLLDIGLYPTLENFEMLTGIYKYMLEDRQQLNTKYSDLLKKIFTESRAALIGELSNNPYNQTNKIFLAKAVYGLKEDTPTKHIEVTHNIRNIDNLPMFGNNDN